MRVRDGVGNPDLFWADVHVKLQYLLGTPRLIPGVQATTYMMDALAFLTTCSDDHFLDFIEFALAAYRHLRSEEKVVEDLNQFLRVDDLPYAVTGYVWDQRVEATPFLGGTEHVVHTLVALPQVILMDSQATYALAVEPALTLLKRPEFVVPNTEFLEALADYKRGEYGDCLTKCNSAFESVMKVICNKNKWAYSPSDTASDLLKIVFGKKPTLEPFLKTPLLVVPTMRNTTSPSHGGGATPRKVLPNRAEYALTATAGAILLLVSECA